MSCNYYAVRKPDKNKKDKLVSLIQESSPEKYADIKLLTEELYGDYDNIAECGNVIHLGHSSAGWRFALNANVSDPEHWRTDIVSEPSFLYPLTKQGLHDFLFQEDITIINEYYEVIEKDDFWNMLMNNSYPNEGFDSISYREEYPKEAGFAWDMTKEQARFKKLGFTFKKTWQSDFYSDGLRWAIFSNFS